MFALAVGGFEASHDRTPSSTQRQASLRNGHTSVSVSGVRVTRVRAVVTTGPERYDEHALIGTSFGVGEHQITLCDPSLSRNP